MLEMLFCILKTQLALGVLLGLSPLAAPFWVLPRWLLLSRLPAERPSPRASSSHSWCLRRVQPALLLQHRVSPLSVLPVWDFNRMIVFWQVRG